MLVYNKYLILLYFYVVFVKKRVFGWRLERGGSTFCSHSTAFCVVFLNGVQYLTYGYRVLNCNMQFTKRCSVVRLTYLATLNH